MKLHPRTFRELSSASFEYFTCDFPSGAHGEILIVAFAGEAGNSHEHCGTFSFMDAVIAAGIQAWQPCGLVLDLSRLRYEWGDEMQRTLEIGSSWYRGKFPTAVVVSELNRAGLTSLVTKEMDQEPDEWLFETIDLAVSAVDSQNKGTGNPSWDRLMNGIEQDN